MSELRWQRLYECIGELVFCHSPSGAEAEIDQYLLDRLRGVGADVKQDQAGNVVAKIAGRDSSRTLAITAHKDEIAAIVKRVDERGRVEVRKLGGAFPWVYGEGVVDLLGDRETVSGILSFGSRHVSHESPQKCHQEDTALKWEQVWVDCKRSHADLLASGVRPGTRMVVGKHRKAPYRLGDYIASYTLDNKASMAILLELADTLREPFCDVYLVFTAREEVGAIGAMYFTQQHKIDQLIALEICPKSSEYPLCSDRTPVLISQDGHGLYDEGLNAELAAAGEHVGIPVQRLLLNGFGSDGSLVMKNGHVARAACLGFPTDNTHGYEIAHLQAIAGCLDILQAYVGTDPCNDWDS